MLDIKHATLGDILTVNLTGQLNTLGCGQLGEVLDGWLATGGSNTLIDFAGVTYINSSGLRLLWRHHSLVTGKNGQVVFSSVHYTIFQVFDISGLAHLFQFANTFDEALGRFQPPPADGPAQTA
ncbi:STAS domain-containing protein [Xanthobacter oligotrophicus]|uniref:STAS domain-containing protein n=1 Tax=Xanthobacter oligotrophicus TaxID=2607286 RepID=UPI0011F36C68|nr:STAS domain-containing protein [Xanthobacter oligotrophicus]MCG5237813.1 STAS domain-containing protein [Xanthobacter oligotrophicus]